MNEPTMISKIRLVRCGKFTAGIGVMLFFLMLVLFQGQSFAADTGNSAVTKAQTQKKASTSNKDVFTLQEVVITAQKRPEKLMNAPVSASVLSPEMLQNSNISDVSELNNLVPSIQLNGTISGRVPMGIRGISSVSNEQAVGVSSGVAIEIDGVPVPSDSFAGNLVEDAQSIEVLLGPQATLGGRTASSGVINYVTRKPTPNFAGGGSITWTGDNEKRFSGYVSGPFSDKLLSSLTGFYNYTPYPIQNILLGQTTTQESFGGRGKLEWKPTDDFNAMLTLHYARAEADGFNFVYTYMSPYAITAYPMTLTPKFDPPYEFFNPDLTPSKPGDVSFGGTQSELLSGINVNMNNQNFSSPVTDAGAVHADKDIRLDLNYKMGGLTLSLITAYQFESQHVVQDLFAINQYIYPAFTNFLANVAHAPQFVIDGVPHFQNKQDIFADVEQISQELKVVSPADQRISFVAGAFFSTTKVDLSQLRNFFNPAPGGAFVNIHVTPITSTYDVYGRVTSKLTDKTSLVTGLRFNYDYLKYTYNQYNMSGYGPFYSEGSDGSTALVGDISLQHKLDDGTMIYGTYSRGYAPKAYNTASTLHSNEPLTPVSQEHINNFEIGSKGLYFHTLQLNVSAFYTIYKDYQIQTFVTEPGSSFPELNLQSAGKASTKGVELNMTWVPVSTFTAGFSAAYIDAKFDTYTDAECYGNTPSTRPSGCVETPSGVWVQDVSGKPMPNSPKFKFVLNAEKLFYLPNTNYDLALGGNYSYRTKAQMLPDQNPHAIQDAFGILDLHVRLDWQVRNISLTAFCNNVFDKNYYADLEDFWTGPWDGNVVIGQPARDASRYFGLRLDMHF